MVTNEEKNAARALAFLLLAAVASATAGLVKAQQPYPAKPVHLIVPFPGGSSTDTFLRVITPALVKSLGQPVIVEPKPGAGAVLATSYVMAQPNDGYTIMSSTSSQSISSAKANPPFDIRKDLTHVVQLTGGPIFIAVNVAKLPNVKTMNDFIDYARAHPGEVNFGSYGAGSLGQLAVELFNQVENVQTVHVPYKGSSANVLALANGDSHAAVDVLGFMDPQIQAGKIRVLAATTQERSPVALQYPGMRDAGLPEYTVLFWQGVAGPAGLSKEVVAKLNGAFNAALKDSAAIDFSTKTQVILYGGSAEAITDIVNREVPMWSKLIRDARITID